MVSTPDSESGDPSSNLGGTSNFCFSFGENVNFKASFSRLLCTPSGRDSSVGRALD